MNEELLFNDEVDKNKKRLEKPIHLMAKEGYHKMLNYINDTYAFIVVHSEYKDFYIGNWLEGFGFVDIQFPKNKTRSLTKEEQEKINNSRIVII